MVNKMLAGVPRETDAARSGVTRNAASVSQSTMQEGISSVNLGSGVGRKDWLEGAV